MDGEWTQMDTTGLEWTQIDVRGRPLFFYLFGPCWALFGPRPKKGKIVLVIGGASPQGGAGSSDTKKRKGPTPRECPEPLFKLRRLEGGGSGRHEYENRQKLEMIM